MNKILGNRIKLEVFSQGKTKERNEDYYSYTQDAFVLVDGATDKIEKTYYAKTGGEIISKLVAETCLSTGLEGSSLVAFLNDSVAKLYDQFGINEWRENPQSRFSCGFIFLKVKPGNRIGVTCLGDLGFRINGSQVYQESSAADIYAAKERALFMLKNENEEVTRDHILPILLKKLEYQNKDNREWGYGVIDGTETPEKYIKYFEWNMKDIITVELFTDGYFNIPIGTKISDWETSHKLVQKLDPYKYKDFKSTKSNDDRSVMILNFENYNGAVL